MIAAPIDVPRASGFIPDKLYSSYFMSRIQVRLQTSGAMYKAFVELWVFEKGENTHLR
jgi:hypothetical protein